MVTRHTGLQRSTQRKSQQKTREFTSGIQGLPALVNKGVAPRAFSSGNTDATRRLNKFFTTVRCHVFMTITKSSLILATAIAASVALAGCTPGSA